MKTLSNYFLRVVRYPVCAACLLYGCTTSTDLPLADTDNGGLFLPEGFEALVVVDSLGKGRHLAVNNNGDIYMKMRETTAKGGSVALRDTNQDGRADIIRFFGDYEDSKNYGTAMKIYNGFLYFSTSEAVYRTRLEDGELVPTQATEVVLRDTTVINGGRVEHSAKSIAFDKEGNLYVSFGAPGDVCQEENRKPGSPGKNPCDELEWFGGIWRFDANKLNQVQADGEKYATGIRSVVGMDWDPSDNNLYVAQHGRDNFSRVWPELYSAWESALFPSEEFFRVTKDFDGGWPYYYYDHLREKKLLNPEYGGDKEKSGNADQIGQPVVGFPGHFAPNQVFFYQGDQFPERYRRGAFVAMHGSTIRAPYPQAGYLVAFVPMENGKATGPWEVFADGFAGIDTIVNTSDAHARPVGIAMGPDGSLYISDSVKGKIWRVMYKGKKSSFGPTQLVAMEARKARTNIKTPDEKEDNLQKGTIAAGAQLYNTYCASCHLTDGNGDGNRYPSLVASERVSGNARKLIEVVVKGLSGPIKVKDKTFNGVMPPHDFLTDDQVAQILTYLRMGFKNNSYPIATADVKRVRESL
jgi:glucose/arabinose dehydrogenase/mono/diheme cytochrome c family protein